MELLHLSLSHVEDILLQNFRLPGLIGGLSSCLGSGLGPGQTAQLPAQSQGQLGGSSLPGNLTDKDLDSFYVTHRPQTIYQPSY